VIIAGTGHRPDKLPNRLEGYRPRAEHRVRAVAIQALDEHRPDLVISGMALGWDTALALAAVSLDIPFVAAVPFEGQERQWPDAAQQRYRELLTKALVVEYTSLGLYAAWKMQRRNQWMVEQLTGPDDFVLALWDGSDGGTANCVRYAEKRGARIVNVYDAWKAAA
jgi:uncharacterized phage-like protein YoqJ